jgi:hypothetical protein
MPGSTSNCTFSRGLYACHGVQRLHIPASSVPASVPRSTHRRDVYSPRDSSASVLSPYPPCSRFSAYRTSPLSSASETTHRTRPSEAVVRLQSLLERSVGRVLISELHSRRSMTPSAMSRLLVRYCADGQCRSHPNWRMTHVEDHSIVGFERVGFCESEARLWRFDERALPRANSVPDHLLEPTVSEIPKEPADFLCAPHEGPG